MITDKTVVHQQCFEDPRLRVAYLTGDGSIEAYPPEITQKGVGGKFLPSGEANFFPGNTFICHISPQSQAFAALNQLSSKLQNGPTAEYFSFLPASSFHMTVFPAVCGDPLGHDGWPKDLPTQTELEGICELYRARLVGKTGFEYCTVRPIGTIAATDVILEGATPDNTAALWAARNMLQDLTGLYRQDFLSYTFHITICYRIRWMDELTAQKHLDFALPLFDEFKQRVRKIELGPIEFCAFSSMKHFTTLTKI